MKFIIVPVEEIPKAEEVPTDNLLNIFRVITHMEKICTDNQGVGLSACQIGIPWKLFIVERDNKYEYYVNCDYIGIGDKSLSVEGCLSLRNKDGSFRRFEVERFSQVVIKGKRLKVSDSPSLILEDCNQIEKDLYAVVFQHEVDHIFGREKMIDKIGEELFIYQNK